MRPSLFPALFLAGAALAQYPCGPPIQGLTCSNAQTCVANGTLPYPGTTGGCNSGGGNYPYAPCTTYSCQVIPSMSIAAEGNQIAYGTFFPNTKRTGRLIRTTTAGNKPLPDQIPTGAWNSFAGIGNTRFVVNESYDQTLTPLSYVTISAEASTSGSSSIDSASSYLVNELYKFRVMILLDVSNTGMSALGSAVGGGSQAYSRYILGAAQRAISNFNDAYLPDGGTGTYTGPSFINPSSQTAPVVFSVVAFAGSKRLATLISWTPYWNLANILLDTASSSSPWFYANQPYWFADDSCALYWAVGAATDALAAAVASDVQPIAYGVLVVASFFLDTTGYKPDNAAYCTAANCAPLYSSLGAIASAKSGSSALDAYGLPPISFIALPYGNSAPGTGPDGAGPIATSARTLLASGVNGKVSGPYSPTGSDLGNDINAAIAYYINGRATSAVNPLPGNSLYLLSFCPTFKGGATSLGSLQVSSNAYMPPIVAGVAPVSVLLSYPAPPDALCNPDRATATPTPTPTVACQPYASATPAPTYAPACAALGGAYGVAPIKTTAGYYVECYPYPTLWPAPTPGPTNCPSQVAFPGAVPVSIASPPVGESVALAFIILLLIAALATYIYCASCRGPAYTIGDAAPHYTANPAVAHPGSTAGAAFLPQSSGSKVSGLVATQQYGGSPISSAPGV